MASVDGSKRLQASSDKKDKEDEKDENSVLLGKHVQSRREVNVALDNDEQNTIDCAVMPNGNIVICDDCNDRLQLFDNSWVCQGSLSVPGIFGVSVVDPNTVIVTVPDEERLQYVQILPQLQLGRTIQLDSQCWGVCVSGDDIYVTCGAPSDEFEIRVIGLDGTEKRRIPLDRNRYVYNITLSPSGEKIFFTGFDNTEIVTCMTLDGSIVYKYDDGNLKCARGMYCDSEDNLFVIDSRSSSVHAITADGKSGGTLLTSSDGLDRPQCIAYRSSDNELIIGCYAFNHLLVYKMTN